MLTEKELKKLNRYELLELLVAQGKKLDRLQAELDEANAELERRKIAVDSSGSMAEAALKLNGIFLYRFVINRLQIFAFKNHLNTSVIWRP